MTPPRRIAFQLTSLLDLLLIVFFSQYLEVRIRADQQQDQWLSEQEAWRRQQNVVHEQVTTLEQRVLELQSAEVESSTLRNDLKEERLQRDRLGQLVAEFFRIPAETVDQILSQWRTGTPGVKSQDRSDIPAEVRRLAAGHSQDVIEHLLTFDELRKRSDLWTLYLRDDGLFVIEAEGGRAEFRADTADGFASQIRKFLKTQPETKSLVLLLVSYGDARFDVRQAMFAALPEAMKQLREESGDRSRFDYAILGYRTREAVSGEAGSTSR
jgi:hypothetical protein